MRSLLLASVRRAELRRRIGEAIGEIFRTIAGITEPRGERRMVVLAFGVDDMSDELRALIDEDATAAQEIARGSFRARIT